MLYSQTTLVSTNLTTNEAYNKAKYKKFKDKVTGQFSNPYNKGSILKNIIEFIKSIIEFIKKIN